ncbi:MAG: hypothetical protein V3W41_18785 [Planctomycetota bacterium]
MKTERVFLLKIGDAFEMGLLEGQLEGDTAPKGNWVEVRTIASSPVTQNLIDRLEERGVEFFMRDERHFSRKELRTAKALHLDPSHRDVECRAASSDTWNWDDVCGRCMRVPEQTGPIMVAPQDLESHIARGRRGEFLVSEHIATRMIRDGITGCILREVLFFEQDEPTPAPYFQVFPIRELPVTVSPPTRFLNNDQDCAVCGRGGMFLNSMLYYDLPVEDIEDLNVTSELFGNGPGLYPELVVSPRFFNLLISCGAEIEEPEPVIFV